MELFPKIRPYRHGYLDVGDGHSLYYELCGNPKAKPVLFIHGGPGQGCSPNSRRFFNPKKWNIILFDQRGAGRSKPFASTKANTTWKLVSDIRKLLQFLKIGKVFLFGGSWGSTLSLVYAIKHPETVTGILLRGVFLGRKWDMYYTFGGGAEEYFPDSWERFASKVPKGIRGNSSKLMRYYYQKMLSKNKAVARKYAFEWSRYELSMLKLSMPEKAIKAVMKEYNYISLATLECHYMVNKCFLPENYILKNAHRISSRKIPVSIVQGRYDILCPPIQAWLLHKAIPKSKLVLLPGGHGSSEVGVKEMLVGEMKRMESIVRK